MNYKKLSIYLTINNIYISIGIVSIIVVALMNFLALGNNIIPKDESWYLLLVKDQVHLSSTQFNLLFGSYFGQNAYANRLLCYALQIFGSFVFAIGLGIYIAKSTGKNKHICFLYSLIAVFVGQLFSFPSCPSLNYINLNKVIAEISIGFLLIGCCKEHICFSLLSGIVFGFLFFVMITNVIMVLGLFLLAYLLSNNYKKDILIFIMGIAITIAFFFSAIESPIEYIHSFGNEISDIKGRESKDYGYIFFIKWINDAVLYLFNNALTALLIVFSYKSIKRHLQFHNEITDYLIKSLLFTLFFLFSSYNFHHYASLGANFNILVHNLLWILLFQRIFEDIEKQNISPKNLFVIVILCFSAVCQSFGSNIWFSLRGLRYMVFVMPAIILLCDNNCKTRKITNIIITVFQIVFFFVFLTNRNWYGDKFFGNNKIALKEIGINQNVKLDKYHIDNLDTCKNNVPEGRVLCSNRKWLEVYLLGYTPITYNFDVDRLSEPQLEYMIKKELSTNNHLWVISDTTNATLNKKITNIPDVMIVSKQSGENVYMLIK